MAALRPGHDARGTRRGDRDGGGERRGAVVSRAGSGRHHIAAHARLASREPSTVSARGAPPHDERNDREAKGGDARMVGKPSQQKPAQPSGGQSKPSQPQPSTPKK